MSELDTKNKELDKKIKKSEKLLNFFYEDANEETKEIIKGYKALQEIKHLQELNNTYEEFLNLLDEIKKAHENNSRKINRNIIVTSVVLVFSFWASLLITVKYFL